MKRGWEIFLKEKPVRVLTILYEKTRPLNLIELSRLVNTPYAHTLKIVKELESVGLIESKRIGRSRIVTITDKGVYIARRLLDIINNI